MDIKGFFFETDDKKEDKKTSTESAIPKIATPPTSPSFPPAPTSVTSFIQPSYQPPSQGVYHVPNQEDIDKMSKHFSDLLDSSNFPGADYYEFLKMCQAMNTLPDDQKFPAVFAGLSFQGLTKQILLDSAAKYVDIINKDVDNFSSVVDAKMMSEVKSKRQHAEELKTGIVNKQEAIRQLQEEIQKDSQSIIDITNDANEQEQKATSKFNTYKSVAESFKNAINADIQKINTYLK